MTSQLPLPLGDRRRDYIASLYASGLTIEEIAEREDITPQSVCKCLRKYRRDFPGSLPHRKQWAHQKRNRIAA